MSVFFTDTDCEIWYTDVDKYNIKVIGMPYTLDGVEYFYDMGRNTDLKLLFNRMREGSTPITSALNPQNYIDYFEPVLQAGEDILYIHFSDQLSGTFNHMNVALKELREKYPERKITTFDTKSICWGAGFQVLEAAKMHQAGKSDEEIVEFLKDFTSHVVTTFVVDSLSHLKRGGRISATTAIIGGMLNIKPVLKIDDEGKIVKCGTGKGMKKTLMSMVDDLMKNIRNVGEYPIYIIDGDNEPMAEFLKSQLQSKLGEKQKIENYPIGPVIGAHCGPGTIGIIYYGEKR